MFGLGKSFESAPAVKPEGETKPKRKKTGLLKAIGLAAMVAAGSVHAGQKAPEKPADLGDNEKIETIDLQYKGGINMEERLAQVNEEKTLEQLKRENAKTNERNWEHNRGLDEHGTGGSGVAMGE